MDDKEHLLAAAHMVTEQAEAHPGLGIPVDPDVAEYMGASEEDGEIPQEFQEQEPSHGEN